MGQICFVLKDKVREAGLAALSNRKISNFGNYQDVVIFTLFEHWTSRNWLIFGAVSTIRRAVRSQSVRGSAIFAFFSLFLMFDAEIGIARIELTVQFFVSEFSSQLKINIPSIIL